MFSSTWSPSPQARSRQQGFGLNPLSSSNQPFALSLPFSTLQPGAPPKAHNYPIIFPCCFPTAQETIMETPEQRVVN